jgi:hypothetical protein
VNQQGTIMNRLLKGAAIFLAATLGATAQADPVSVRLTARDNYWAYTAAADGSNLALLGGDSNYAVAENYNTNVSAGSYLYVVAWTGTGQEDQAFQGMVTTLSGTTYTNGSDWEAVAVASPFPGFSSTTAALADATVQAEIAGASWQTTMAVAPANTWGDRVGGGQANWIWLNTFTPGNGPTGYAIFRTALSPSGGGSNQVPEPGSAALVLTSLAAVGLARRRRPRLSA